jgi:hypothetical protein
MRALLTILFLFSVAYGQIIKIKPVHIQDWSGSSMGMEKGELLSGASPSNWFDGNGDPNAYNPDLFYYAGNDSSGFSTGAVPYRGFYHVQGTDGFGNRWRGSRNMRYLFDLVGDTNMFKLAKYGIREIYGLQIAPQGGVYDDTLFFYNFDTVFNVLPQNRWAYIARPDSMLHPFAYLTYGSPIFYYPTWAHDSFPRNDMRYMLVRMKYVDRGFFATHPDFRELAIYGEKLFTDDTIYRRPPSYTGPMPKPKKVKEILGSNDAGADADQFYSDGLRRIYQKIEAQYDRVSVPLSDPSRVYNFNFYNANTSQWLSDTLVSQRGVRVVLSIRGASKYIGDRVGNTEAINVTEPYMEPEDWHSYYGDAHFFTSLTKLFGENTDTTFYSYYRISNTSQIPGPPVGKGSIYPVGTLYIEPGNEDEFRGSTIPTLVARALAYWDGMKGMLSDGVHPLGIKTIDPTAQIVMPARVYLDSNFVASFIFLSKLQHPDRIVPFDIANMHHYARTYNDLDHGPTYEDEVNGRGRTPEQDKMYERVTKSVKHLYNYLNGDTSKQWFLSEYGYDNYSVHPNSVDQLAFGPPCFCIWTTSATPRFPGYDSVQSKGIAMLRSELIFAAAGISGYHEFSMFNGGYTGNNNSAQLFATSGRAGDTLGSGTNLDKKFANWWVRSSTFLRYGDYRFDSLVTKGDSVGAWVLKFVKPGTDSAMYAVWNGTQNGSQTASVLLRFKPLTGNSNNYKISFTQDNGATSLRSVVNNTLTVTAKEEPEFYFVQETSLPVPTSTIFKLRGRVKIQ